MRELGLGNEGDTPLSNPRLKHESMSATHCPEDQRFKLKRNELKNPFNSNAI